MNEEEMKAIKLHETEPVPGETNVFIRRIPNGWMYEYYDSEMDFLFAVPVYEVLPIKEHTLPRLP